MADFNGLLKTNSFINGQWVGSIDQAAFEVLDPATGELVANCADLGVDETRAAIELAYKALGTWKAKTAKERSILLRRWYDLVMENQEPLARLMTVEQGKAITESRTEIAYGASFIEWFAEEAKRSYGDVIPTVANDRRLLTIKQPVGVVSAITPWNFPNAMITRKAAPALAAGCTIVIKPAKETPLSALALAELAKQAGIPDGVFNVVTSSKSREVGRELTTNPLVKKITFTGSTPVGKVLLEQAAKTVKKVSMELGGNAPILVFEDADLEQAAAGALASKFRNCGQTCICANRILVHESVYDQFVSVFTEKVRQLKQGCGLSEDTDLGPLINERAVQDVHSLVEDAKAKGAVVMSGGESAGGDCFYPATVLAEVPQSARVFSEEIFGPVAPIFKFSSEQEAIDMANDTEFGLASYVFTQNMGRAWRVSEAIEYGMVGVNEVGITSEVIPFGGVKESGLGREGSKYGMDDFTEVKYICMGGM
jgi:succinate-semialdehyde dehydrogenase/glutarate-semialdehyde dehydrogenase